MKRLLVILLLLPSLAFGGFTEFYTQSGGSNLNAGSTTNNTAAYTSASGNWVLSTRVFTVTDGTNPSSSVSVGDFMSVYANAASSTGYVTRVTNVQNATNGTITGSTTVQAGNAPSNSTGGITIKTGGAWKGPNAAVGVPLSLVTLTALKNTNGDTFRLNMKNDATYSITTGITMSTNANGGWIQGYSSTVNDKGRAIIDGGTSLITVLNTGSGPLNFADLVISNNGTSGTNDLVIGGSLVNFYRCVFHDARANCVNTSGDGLFIECEFSTCNTSNTNTDGALNFTGGSGIVGYVERCYFHGNTGSNNDDIVISSGTSTGIVLVNNIFDSAGRYGVNIGISTNAQDFVVANGNDFYNAGTAAIHFNTAQIHSGVFENNTIAKNGTYGIDGGAATHLSGFIYNSGYGAGTYANSTANTHSLDNVTDTNSVSYASNVSPWVAETTGNFTHVWATAGTGAGRGAWMETQNSKTGTVGYPDIGGPQAPTPTATATATPTSTATPTPTATATASFTPCAATPTATSTFTPTATATSTATSTPTATATASFTPCFCPDTPTPTPTSTPTSTPTATPTAPIEVSYGFTQ